MLKLKYLFNNTDLATMILGNWEYNEQSLELFQHYRISSNAIYPYSYEGRTRLLRFAPQSEKKRDNWTAELDFIRYLDGSGLGVLQSVTSTRGEELVEAHTPWGDYYASVFERVAGDRLDHIELNESIIHLYGLTLGRLHRLSRSYKPEGAKRWAHVDVLDWIEQELAAFPDRQELVKEAAILRTELAQLPMTDDRYGLIHYDYDFDNAFYDAEPSKINVIDFDDAMYHWYAMDIENALESMQSEVSSDMYPLYRERFLDGYSAEFEVPADLETTLPLFRRFGKLYGDVRTLRSAAERWDHEPDWMVRLRERLAAL